MRTLPTELAVCAVCGSVGDDWGPGPGGRPRAACRSCGCLERQRLLSLLLPGMLSQASLGSVVLDVAPTKHLSGLIRELRPGAYLSVDLDPAADRRTVSVAASLTHLPLKDASVGLAVVYHVLEHVPDDAAAMRELARVLHPSGVAIVQVPRRPGATDEDPSAPEEERIIRFGQADHVRWYGDDFEGRLQAQGLSVRTLRSIELVDPALLAPLGIDVDEEVWVVMRAGGESSAEVTTGAGLASALARIARRASQIPTQPVAPATTASAAAAATPAPSFSRRVRRRLARLRGR